MVFLLSLFTFHYGSILINDSDYGVSVKSIYIPLWFYSNNRFIHIIAGKRFIYIPLWFYSNTIRNSFRRFFRNIYIPLWFYSNTALCSKFFGRFYIYIPLWFYSNSDVPIGSRGQPNLHSTMVLF